MATRTLYSLGEVAQRHGVPVHRVTYALRSKEIEPTEVASGMHLYDLAKMQEIGRALAAIERSGNAHRSAMPMAPAGPGSILSAIE